ncbi:putative formin homology 2 (FH2) domain protein [Trypanosoma cruzi]|uniref:Putative formin homology 2 (FH2) domain protein n=1 Tax=Trypanosoma cruzi TaxID=5693 RepID=A0A2V2XDD0_TRYCR|nr:putative formin homology 2 (FH2) domain protein [Trypanosoma cruzi]
MSVTSISPIGGTTGSSTSVRDAIDILLYEENQGQRKRKLVLELNTLVQGAEFAEQFLEEDGLNILLLQIKTASGNLQAAMLSVLRNLLVYVNAVEQIAETPELVERIYGLLVPSHDGSLVPLNIAKPTLETLIVICGMVEGGHKMINQAAKKRIGVGVLPYAPLVPLLSGDDLLVTHKTLLFMNILLKKKKEVSELKAKKLFFRWKECGVLSLLKRLTVIEDADVAKQLASFQRLSNFTIPRSWEEASKYRLQYEEAKRKCDAAMDALYVFQQQQAKVRMLKQELERTQETVRAMRLLIPHTSVNYHPARRFHAGGGLHVDQLASGKLEPIDVSAGQNEITAARMALLEKFVTANDIRPVVSKMFAAGPAGRHAAMNNDDEHFAPSDGDDEEDMMPPPSDESDAPPPDDEEDDKSNNEEAASNGAAQQKQQQQQQQTAPKGEKPLPPPPPPSLPVASQQHPQQRSALPAKAGPPPPPPPPTSAGGKKGAPPPPPPPPSGAKKPPNGNLPVPGPAAKTPSAPSKVFFKGPAPKKRMKPLHWDKIPFSDTVESVWSLINAGTLHDTTFDYAEFEQLFSQKEVEAKPVSQPRPQKVLLLREDLHRNLSIVLHKLPSIPNVQRALFDLDANVLSREMLTAMLAQAPTDEVRAEFLKNANKKPEEEYEPQEKYMAMMIAMPEFRRRVSAWLFSIEWEESRQAVLKPMHRLQESMVAVLNSKYLPYYLGLLLNFGNMMNYGDARRGNAGAVNLSLLDKLELTKDNKGKLSLFTYLVTTVKVRRPEALHLIDEMKPVLTANVMQISWGDVEMAMQEAEKAVQVFQNHCTFVKKKLVELGTDAEDPFVPFAVEFTMRVTGELQELKQHYGRLDNTRIKFLQYFGIIDAKKKPEDIFSQLVPFIERVRRSMQEMVKKERRNMKKGQKLGDGEFAHVVQKLQEQVAL